MERWSAVSANLSKFVFRNILKVLSKSKNEKKPEKKRNFVSKCIS